MRLPTIRYIQTISIAAAAGLEIYKLTRGRRSGPLLTSVFSISLMAEPAADEKPVGLLV
jgi:hypothetical protein